MTNDQVSVLARVYMGVERHKITDFEAERTTYATRPGRNNQALWCALKQVNTRRFIQSFDSIPSPAEIASCTSQDFVKDICKVNSNLLLSYFWVSL